MHFIRNRKERLCLELIMSGLVLNIGGIFGSQVLGQEPVGDRRPVVLIFLGLSGSGKSTTINTIFNQPLTKSGSESSTTSEIIEFSLNFTNGGNELRIIDTPGLQDTRGIEEDARFLATLDGYIKNHEILRNRPPDAVVICHRFDDNRFSGPGALFVKMLKSLTAAEGILVWKDDFASEFEAKSNNIMLLLTHVAGVNLNIAQKPSGKISEFRKAISEYTSLPGNTLPVVLGENQGHEQDLELVSDEGHRLANGDIFPQNLCFALKVLITKQRPSLNIDSLQLCSPTGKDFVSSILSRTHLIDISHPKAQSMHNLLTKLSLNVNETEISQLLETKFSTLSGSNSNIRPSSLGYLQAALNSEKIFSQSDLPANTLETAALFRKLNKNQDVNLLLKMAFALEPPALNSFSLGHGYSDMTDFPLPTPVLKLELSKHVSCLGFLLLNGTECKLIPLRTKIIEKTSASVQEYLQQRNLDLSLPQIQRSVQRSSIRTKPGYSLTASSSRSVYVEFQAFEVGVQNVYLSDELLTDLAVLPKFNQSERKSIDAYDKFIQQYGAHVIQKLYGGGYIHFEISKSSVENIPIETIDNLVAATVLKKDIKITMFGGDFKYHTSRVVAVRFRTGPEPYFTVRFGSGSIFS